MNQVERYDQMNNPTLSMSTVILITYCLLAFRVSSACLHAGCSVRVQAMPPDDDLLWLCSDADSGVLYPRSGGFLNKVSKRVAVERPRAQNDHPGRSQTRGPRPWKQAPMNNNGHNTDNNDNNDDNNNKHK